ncbi:SGNH/GDSL hydrolase family protein [Mycolicibacterium sphagni]|uniref:SGNH/GDSL hydrolase family protein n=1 Tax=Mycolicibacterium sphagni TaxID=1786 RepID=UPI0021F2AA3F|nr:SGNH/GDSL hydrolase family protein [Mycolicibacterium sphagni]MCV7176759.1 SGNH/GDSL hydrolase family protein [Mycolicibacterium sphagni]
MTFWPDVGQPVQAQIVAGVLQDSNGNPGVAMPSTVGHYQVDFYGITVGNLNATIPADTFPPNPDTTTLRLSDFYGSQITPKIVSPPAGSPGMVVNPANILGITTLGRQLLSMPDINTLRSDITAASVSSIRRPLNNNFVVIGDSITTSQDHYHANGGGPGYFPYLGESWYNRLCVESFQRMRFAGYWCQDGTGLAYALSTLLPNVLALNPAPGACAVMAGINDVDSGVPFSTMVASLKGIVTQLLAASIVPILVAIPPDECTVLNPTVPGKDPAVRAWNTWIRRYAANNGLPLIDAYTPCAKLDGTWWPGMTSDFINPNGWGNAAISKQVLGDGLTDIFAPTATVLTSRASTDVTNLFSNGSTLNYGLFTTNTAGLGAGLTKGGSGTAAIVTPSASDQLAGNWQQVSCPAGSTATTLGATFSSGWSVGDTLAFSARVQTSNLNSAWAAASTAPAAPNALYCYLAASIPGGIVMPTGTKTTVYQGMFNWLADISDGLLYYEFPVPPGTTGLSLGMGIGLYTGSGTTTGNPVARFGEVTLINLTTGGLLV